MNDENGDILSGDSAQSSKPEADVTSSSEPQADILDFSAQAMANANVANLLGGIDLTLRRTYDAIMGKIQDLENRVHDMENNLRDLIEETFEDEEQTGSPKHMDANSDGQSGEAAPLCKESSKE